LLGGYSFNNFATASLDAPQRGRQFLRSGRKSGYYKKTIFSPPEADMHTALRLKVATLVGYVLLSTATVILLADDGPARGQLVFAVAGRP
jgi:hypothetical protein